MKPFKVKLLKGSRVVWVFTRARDQVAACIRASRRYKLPHCNEAQEVGAL